MADMLHMDSLRIAIAQLNPVVGDLHGNAMKARAALKEAAAQDAQILVFSELFITGYPPEDLILKPAFVAAAMDEVRALAKETGAGAPAMVMGTPWCKDGKTYNSVALLDEGEVKTLRHKVDLPNYGVFDEKRVFTSGPLPGPINFKGVRLGVPICEDIWDEEVVECLEETGAKILIVLNGSPFSTGKPDIRMNVAAARVTQSRLPLVYVNQVGGQDELVFDGASFVLSSASQLTAQLPAWREAVVTTAWRKLDDVWVPEPSNLEVNADGDEAVYRACVLGLRDYVRKNGFRGVVLGLSGGIDSAICAAMAVDALGPQQVHAIMMPYDYTSKESLEDAAACAQALGIRYDIVPIHEPTGAFFVSLSPLFKDLPADTTEENIQSRVRGTLLMAVSNKFGSMVVTTGNKSENSVGYATLYGDMNGGFNPIKDLYKTQVFALANYRNLNRPEAMLAPDGIVIPENIISKPPTAELRENQTDQDSLPPYEVLDDILACLVEQEMPVKDIIERGHDQETVQKVARLLYVAEYKRRQAAPGVKISSKNFGRDRRYPITNKFRE